jgi:XTP/dITP diphosphohydrolase
MKAMENFPVRLERGGTLVIATHNRGKLWEIQRLLDPYGIEALAAGDLGVPEPEETGSTFEANASLKAVACATATGRLSLADDSGLVVDALDGAPGIYSARWAGEGRDFSLAMERVERELQEKGATAPEQRQAYFICVLCLANPQGAVQFFEGRVAGHVIWPPRGVNGFGYDPMFVPDGYDITFGEMEPARKYELTHRARAFDKFKAAILG